MNTTMARINGTRKMAALFGVVAMCSTVGCFVEGEEVDDGALDTSEEIGAAEEALQTCNLCPSNMVGYRGQNGTQLLCLCTGAGGGGVWGTNLYTDDSSVCRAAVHAGAIPATGGAVLVTVQPGTLSYAGSTANGVTSYSYGGSNGSFTVAAGTPCELPPPPPPPCPTSLEGVTTSGTCTCNRTFTNRVYGTGVFTDHSDPCGAAWHAGVLPPNTMGTVSYTIESGEERYCGSTQNGVMTFISGPRSRSFSVGSSALQKIPLVPRENQYQEYSLQRTINDTWVNAQVETGCLPSPVSIVYSSADSGSLIAIAGMNKQRVLGNHIEPTYTNYTVNFNAWTPCSSVCPSEL